MFIRFDMIYERDRQTNGQTPHDSIDRACIASRGKICIPTLQIGFVSVSSFNSRKRQPQVPLQIYSCVQFKSVLFSSLRRCRTCWL